MISGAGTGSDSLVYVLDNQYRDYITVSEEKLDNTLDLVRNEFYKLRESMYPGG